MCINNSLPYITASGLSSRVSCRKRRSLSPYPFGLAKVGILFKVSQNLIETM